MWCVGMYILFFSFFFLSFLWNNFVVWGFSFLVCCNIAYTHTIFLSFFSFQKSHIWKHKGCHALCAFFLFFFSIFAIKLRCVWGQFVFVLQPPHTFLFQIFIYIFPNFNFPFLFYSNLCHCICHCLCHCHISMIANHQTFFFIFYFFFFLWDHFKRKIFFFIIRIFAIVCNHEKTQQNKHTPHTEKQNEYKKKQKKKKKKKLTLFFFCSHCFFEWMPL